MFEPTEVIAEFPSEGEAEVALARLREEGIEGSVTGNVPNAATFSLFGRMPYAPIQLAVVASEAERAREILKHHEESLQEGWEEDAEAAIDGWICANCDTEVTLEVMFCPECGSPRSAVRVEDEDEDGND
jgi:hypothetical protein